MFAFWFIGYDLEIPLWRIVASGTFVGLTSKLHLFQRKKHQKGSLTLASLAHALLCVVQTSIPHRVLLCKRLPLTPLTPDRHRCLRFDPRIHGCHRRVLCVLQIPRTMVRIVLEACSLQPFPGFCRVRVSEHNPHRADDRMHYLGLGGTSYSVKNGVSPATLINGGHQNTRLIIGRSPRRKNILFLSQLTVATAISVMCGVIVILSIAFSFTDLITRREIRKKARHIVVASATFAEDGKILVKHDGTIPMQMIETEAELKVGLWIKQR